MTAVGEGLHQAIAGDAFPTSNLGHAALQTSIQIDSCLRRQFRLVVQQSERIGDDFGGVAVRAAVDLLLDAGFGGGVEHHGHGRGIRRDRERGGGFAGWARSSRGVCGMVVAIEARGTGGESIVAIREHT